MSKRPDKACESLGAISDMRDAGCGEKAAPEASASAADAPHSTRYKSSLAGQSAYERRAQALARRGLDEEDMHFIGAMASHSPPWKTPPPETGLAGIADVAVTKAIREGAFDNLAGMGKPLKQGDDHSFQFYTVDPTMQAVNRILKENNFKTASLELRDDLCYAEAQLFELVTKCLTPSCGHTDVRGNREVSLKLQVRYNRCTSVQSYKFSIDGHIPSPDAYP